MRRLAALLMAAVAIGLVGAIDLELRRGSSDEGAMQTPQPTPAVARQGAAPVPQAANAQAWVEVILARPLFSPDRRPTPDAPGQGAPAAAALPRVAGILVSGTSRSVIFAAAEGAHPIVATEGTLVNGFRVQAIEAGQVTVLGPDGPRVLRPTFDPHPPAPPTPATAAGSIGLPGLQNLSGIPGLPTPPGPAAR